MISLLDSIMTEHIDRKLVTGLNKSEDWVDAVEKVVGSFDLKCLSRLGVVGNADCLNSSGRCEWKLVGRCTKSRRLH